MATTARPALVQRRFLVLHGWQNYRAREHWQWQLVASLRDRGEQVLYPQMPNCDNPSLSEWTDLLLAELDQLGPGERVVVAHSLAVLVWLHATPFIKQPVQRVLLVAPPSRRVLATYEELAEFADVTFETGLLRDAAAAVRMVHADDDPFCPEGVAQAYPETEWDIDTCPGGGHLDTEAGYGYWPAVEAWCLDPCTRVTGRAVAIDPFRRDN